MRSSSRLDGPACEGAGSGVSIRQIPVGECDGRLGCGQGWKGVWS